MCARGSSSTPPRRRRWTTSRPGASGSASSPRPAWPRVDLAGGVRRAGPRAAAPGRPQPGDRPRRRAGDLRRDRRRHARPDDHRPRRRGPEAAPPRPDAGRRRGVVPAVLRAGRGLRPRRRADPRAAGERRLAALRPEGVDDQRPVRGVRPAARPHRLRRAQAQGPDDVHRADGRRRRDRPPAAADLRRGALQRGLLRRRRAAGGQRGRAGRRRLGRRDDHADVRARGDRARRRGLRLARRPLRLRPRRRRGRDPRRRGPPPLRRDRLRVPGAALPRLPHADHAPAGARARARRRRWRR